MLSQIAKKGLKQGLQNKNSHHYSPHNSWLRHSASEHHHSTDRAIFLFQFILAWLTSCCPVILYYLCFFPATKYNSLLLLGLPIWFCQTQNLHLWSRYFFRTFKSGTVIQALNMLGGKEVPQREFFKRSWMTAGEERSAGIIWDEFTDCYCFSKWQARTVGKDWGGLLSVGTKKRWLPKCPTSNLSC